jgi:glutaconate CoA-transferase subunit B
MKADPATFAPDEMMAVAASRLLTSEDVCLVGIGAPSTACNLARLTHAPGISLIYESGTMDTRPNILPLSIGDSELCETALTTVSLPEIFGYWLQGGHITIGFLGGAQIDRFANLNTTAIGDYTRPKVRLPGAGGAPEIASGCRKSYIIMDLSPRRFVPRVDFITTFGHGEGGDHRARLGLKTQGPAAVITDLCVLEPDPESKELSVVSLHSGVTRGQVQAQCGWPLRFASAVGETQPPTPVELQTIRALREKTRAAHAKDPE